MLRNAVWFLWWKFWSFSSNLANNVIYQIVSFIWLNNFNVVVLLFENKSLMFTLAISLERICYIYFADFVFSGQHKRTVNRVRFHENDAHLLLSGSQDGTMHIFVSINQPTVSKHINEIVKKRNLELFVDAIFNFKIWFYVK